MRPIEEVIITREGQQVAIIAVIVQVTIKVLPALAKGTEAAKSGCPRRKGRSLPRQNALLQRLLANERKNKNYYMFIKAFCEQSAFLPL